MKKAKKIQVNKKKFERKGSAKVNISVGLLKMNVTDSLLAKLPPPLPKKRSSLITPILDDSDEEKKEENKMEKKLLRIPSGKSAKSAKSSKSNLTI